MGISAATQEFIRDAPPEWSASQVMWEVGKRFIEERRDSLSAIKALDVDAGWLTFLAIKKRVDERLVEWLRNDRKELEAALLATRAKTEETTK